MRLTDDQIQMIRQLADQVAGKDCRVLVFGSRLDVDEPALLAARLSARVSRVMHGRKVDVLLSAPNLMRLPIHDVALQHGALI
ncbi:MAG: hypothetical protein R8J85_09200 [Mariprofundales bacterium]